jgi:hypothetical protein
LGSTDKPDFLFCALTVHDLVPHERHFSLSSDEIKRINPNTNTLPAFRSKTDAQLIDKIYQRMPILIKESNAIKSNPWSIEISTLFHMASDSHFFRTKEQLELSGYAKSGNMYCSRPDDEWLPLYEAKMIHFHNYRYAGYGSRDLVNSDRGYRVLPRHEATELGDRDFENTPFYWVPSKEAERRTESLFSRESIILAIKDVTHATNERTLIGCLFPYSLVSGHSLTHITTSHGDKSKALSVVYGLFSLVSDYVARTKVGGLHMSNFITMQLPVLAEGQISRSQQEFLCERILRLNAFTPRMEYYWDLVSIIPPILTWNTEERDVMAAEVDAMYAYLYGLTRDELRYILDPADLMGPDYPSETFRVLKTNEQRQFGEYRTQRLVLEAWDRLFG